MNFFKGIREGFKDFGHLINSIINSILLAVVYFIAIGPTSIILKISGKRLLALKAKKDAETYWVDYNLKTEPEDNYYRQF